MATEMRKTGTDVVSEMLWGRSPSHPADEKVAVVHLRVQIPRR